MFSEDIPRGSAIWNGFLKARGVAKAKVSWKLGNGEDIQFWSDSWLIQGPLISNPTYDDWVNHCIQLFGPKVCNYRTGQGWVDLSTLLEEDDKFYATQ